MKPIYCLFVLALSVFLFSCTHQNQPMKIVTEDYPPLTYAINDSITGFGTSVVRAIQKELRSKDKISLLNWDQAYEMALKEPNVVIFTMEKTSARDSLFYWIGPLGESKTYFYVRAGSKLKIDNMESAKAVQSIATTSDWFSEQYLKKKDFTNLISSLKPVDNVKQLMNGEVDMSILTDITVKELVKQAGYQPGDLVPVYQVMKTDFYIGISKQTNPTTVEAWNHAFKKIEQKGILDKLRSSWLK